jgi:hypothetical protein
MTKVTEIHNNIPQDEKEMQAIIEKMKRQFPLYLLLLTQQAKFKRAQYNSYVVEGFTETQALEMIKDIL